MKIMIMQSVDGQDYVVPVAVPDEMSADAAIEAASKAIAETKAADPDEWSLEDLEIRIKAADMEVLSYFQGPIWD